MLLLLTACGPSLPETLDATDLYGQWAHDNGAVVQGLSVDAAAEDAGWEHAYVHYRYDSGESTFVDSLGHVVLDGVELTMNPEGEGLPWTAEVLGVDDQALWLRLENGSLWSLESVSAWP
jgi:hypothetical protein